MTKAEAEAQYREESAKCKCCACGQESSVLCMIGMSIAGSETVYNVVYGSLCTYDCFSTRQTTHTVTRCTRKWLWLSPHTIAEAQL